MDILRLVSLTYLQSLGLRELTVLAPYATETSLPVGGRVLLDGPFAQELVLVAGGRGIVRCAGETVGEFGPGDLFGTLAPPRTAYPTATVTARSALRLITFSARDIRHLRRAAPDTLQALLDACAQGPPAQAQDRRPAAAPAAAAAA